jgi:GT2 family glycosyltransferase
MERCQLDVGVIYSGERHYLAPLLASLEGAAEALRFRLLLLDNASAGDTAEWEALIRPTTVLRNPRRLGYAANLNRLLAASTAPYVLLLNTDVYFDPVEPCLARMLAFMEAHPCCGVATCRVYHPDGSYAYPARRFLTPRAIAARRLGLGRLLATTLDRYLYRDRDPRGSYACDWVSGCFLFLRREAALEVGGFDCGFGKYFEDVDLCARLARAGWEVRFHGGSYCYHHEQRASRRLLSRDAWRHLRAYGRWLRKWGLRPAAPLGGCA